MARFKELKNVKFDEGFYQAPIKKTYEEYLDTHKKLYAGRDDKFVCHVDKSVENCHVCRLIEILYEGIRLVHTGLTGIYRIDTILFDRL